MRQPILLETGTHYFAFNTYGTTGAMITLAGTPALRASINGGDYVNAGLTLSVDHDYNGASAVTGAHRIALDIDNVTLALADGDELDVFLSAGTVDSMSKAGTKLWMVVALAAGLTTQEKADVNTEADTALTDSAILALLDDARTEPGQGAPPVNPDVVTKIDYLYKAWRNRHTQSATEYALYADDATTKDQEAVVSDNGTIVDRGEVGTGA